MNIHEERAWRLLLELGARECDLGGKHALDLSPIRATTKNKLCLLVQATIDVVGRSGANRRHVDRRGCPIFVVTDFYTIKSRDSDRHDPEIQALLKKTEARAEATTSWTIHTMGGPICRVFSTVEIAKRWAIDEWTYPKTIEGLVATKRLTQPRSKRETTDVQRRLDDENTEHFERAKSGEIVIEAGNDGSDFTFGIRYKGKHERVFATIGERQHCTSCNHVVATRSDIHGEWHPWSPDPGHWPKDLE